VGDAKEVAQGDLDAGPGLAIPPGAEDELPKVKAAGVDGRPIDVCDLARAIHIEKGDGLSGHKVQKVVVGP
jgi:hypothetical protein